MKRIAIQGAKGSFHDIAAHRYFSGEEIEVIYCATFEDIFSNIKKDDSVIGLMAIENTIAGSLLQNHELLRESDTQIVGEARLHISHSIMCLPEDDWDDITEVNSHPIALMQCREFLNAHPRLKAVEAEDTAKSAEDIFPPQTARAGRHLRKRCCRHVWPENLAGRHRDQQTQLDPLPRLVEPLAGRRPA